MLSQYPELFPQEMDLGFPWHDCYGSVKPSFLGTTVKDPPKVPSR